MGKIVKRSHWNKFHIPRCPQVPRKPKEFFSKLELIGIQKEDNDRIYLKDIEIPKGFTFQDLEIRNEWRNDHEKEILVVYANKQIKNEYYDKEFIKYNMDLIKYEEDLKNWEKEVIEYHAWKKQEEDELLKKQIAEAKKLIKKYEKDNK